MGPHLQRLVLASLLSSSAGAYAVSFSFWIPWSKSCAPELTSTDIHFEDDQAAFETTMEGLAVLNKDHENEPAYQQIKYYAVPRVRWKSNLAAVVLYGGTSEGKTSLLNALPAMFHNYGLPPEQQDWTYGLDSKISETGWTPGLSKRALVAIRQFQTDNKIVHDLHERLPDLQDYVGPADATRSDTTTPILYNMREMPENLAVIDAMDITHGDPRVRRDPFNLAMAERTMVSADVMLVIMDMKTVNNPAILNSIRSTFDRYGGKQMIPVLQADASVTPEMAEAELDKFANIAFNRPVDSQGTPEGVIGKYVMPIDPLVPQGKAHVRMIPLGKSPKFVELLLMIAKNSKDYKEAALLAATESFRMDAARTVRESFKTRLAMQIYFEAIKALSYTIASDNIMNLDYAKSGRYWRNGIEELRAAPMPLMNRVAEVLGKFERDIPDALRALRAIWGKKKSDILTNDRLDQLVLYNRKAVIEMQNQLNSRFLNLIANPDTPNRRAAGDQLQARVESFWRLFPEERSNDDRCDAAPGRVCVHLPRRELLPPNVREMLEQTLHTDATAALNKVAEVETAALSPQSAQAKAALIEIKNKRGFKVFVRDLFWDVSTAGVFAVPLLTIGPSAGANFWSFTIGGIVGHIFARGVRQVAEVKRDRTYLPALNQWFQRLQWVTIERVLSKYLFADVIAALKPVESDVSKAMDSTQQALRFLDPTLPKLPLKLEDTVDHKPLPKVSKKAR